MATANPGNASVSRRAYFYALPYPLPPSTPVPYSLGLPSKNPLNLPETPLEPTHTLVLTSTRKQFVDIRVFKPILPEQPELPNEGGPRDRLDWAFAGFSHSTPILDPFPHGVVDPKDESLRDLQPHRDWPGQITKAEWTHWLDSRHPIPVHLSPDHYSTLVPADTGTMFPLNTFQTLEFGTGINPRTGSKWAYEEFWTDLPIEVTPAASDPDPPKWSVVLRLNAPEHAVRGMVVRLGRWCQGIVMLGDYVSVERWEWKTRGEGEEKEKMGEWERTVRIGDQFLPCAMTFQPGMLKEGGTVKYCDYLWVCEEKVAWRDAAEERENTNRS